MVNSRIHVRGLPGRMLEFMFETSPSSPKHPVADPEPQCAGMAQCTGHDGLWGQRAVEGARECPPSQGQGSALDEGAPRAPSSNRETRKAPTVPAGFPDPSASSPLLARETDLPKISPSLACRSCSQIEASRRAPPSVPVEPSHRRSPPSVFSRVESAVKQYCKIVSACLVA